MVAPRSKAPDQPVSRLWTLVVIALAGVAGSFAGYQAMVSRELSAFHTHFAERAGEWSRAIEREFQAGVVIVESLATFQAATDSLDSVAFCEVTRPILQQHHAIQAVGIDLLIPHPLRAQYESGSSAREPRQIRERGADGSLVRAADREEYVVVDMIEPFVGNEAALGFDIASEPIRKQALLRARDTGTPAVTGRLRLVQESGDQAGVLICAPMYRRDAVTETFEQRRRNLSGYVVGVFRIGDVVEYALNQFQTAWGHVDLIDESATGDERLLYTAAHASQHGASCDMQFEARFDMGGRSWRIGFAPSPAILATIYTWQPVGLLVCGCLMTSLVVAYLLRVSLLNRKLHSEIVERRQTERSLRLFDRALNATANGIVIVDARQPDQPITYVNPAFEVITGYQAEEVLGRNCRFLQGVDRDQPSLIQLRAAIRNLRQARVLVRNYRKDGTLFWNELLIAPIRDGAGLVTHFVGIQCDVTDRIKSEEQQAQLEEQLRHVQKLEAVGTLAAGAAHDFRNLLTVIMGQSEVARMETSEPAVLESLDAIDQISRQAVDFTQALLTCGQRVPTLRVPLHLGDLVTGYGQVLRRTLPAAVELIVEDRSAPTDRILADASQIQQTLMNLAINARDALPDGGCIRIVVDTDPSADTVVLEVEDNGIGMPESVREHVCEPFFTTKPRGRGTGLGLSVTHGIVSAHEARLTIESEEQRGTLVRIAFPASTAVEDGAEFVEGDPQSVHSQGETVLLAEDDAQVRGVIEKALRMAGYEVLVAQDGDELLERFDRHHARIDIAVLDLDLPKRSGLAGLRHIRSYNAQLPVLIITGNIEFNVCSQDGSYLGLLRKPFSISSILTSMRRMLEHKTSDLV